MPYIFSVKTRRCKRHGLHAQQKSTGHKMQAIWFFISDNMAHVFSPLISNRGYTWRVQLEKYEETEL